MAKDKERTLNPAAAHLKSQKKSALKKGKAQVASQRNERLSRRNPERLQRQIDDLKATEAAQGGQLRPRDKQTLEQLEREVKAIRKARETNPSSAGARDDWRGRSDGKPRGRDGTDGGRRGGARLGKRRRDELEDELDTDSEETDEEARNIPMPRDTPPPIPPPRPHKRRHTDNPNQVPLGDNARGQFEPRTEPHPLPPKPAPAKAVYSSAPQIRDLQKEATAKFVPAAVAARLKQRQAFSGGAAGGQKLLEPEEVDALERDGYLNAKKAANEAAKEEAYMSMAASGAGAGGGGSLEEEEAAFERELKEAEEELERERGHREDGDVEVGLSRGERKDLAADARKDARGAALAIAEESKHILNAEAVTAGTHGSEEQKTNALLRYQDVEDIEDDTWG